MNHPSYAFDHIKPSCPVASQCGGCTLQHLAHANHANIKSAWVYKAFQAFINEDTQWQAATPLQAFRRRARWWRGRDTHGTYLGFRAPKSHSAIRHEQCMVVHPEMNSLRSTVEEQMPDAVNALQISYLSDGIHLVFESESDAPDHAWIQALTESVKTNKAVQYWWRTPVYTRPLHKQSGIFHDTLPAGDGSVDLDIGPDDFIQGHAQGNEILVSQVQTWTGKARRVVDLFSGAGNLSLPLAYATHADITGADVSASSVKRANANAKKLGVHAQYIQADLFADFDEQAFSGADILILDPPRKGAKRICRRMSALLPSKIIMIYCNFSAASRDASILSESGYRMKALRTLDLFPYTGHVETMSLWSH